MDKCHTMTFSRRRIPSDFIYKINNNPISRVISMTDLGVLYDTKLEFSAHIDSVVARANSVLGFVRRWSRELRDPYITKTLYLTLVRPILEFSLCSLPWNDPYCLPPYENRLKLLNLLFFSIIQYNHVWQHYTACL